MSDDARTRDAVRSFILEEFLQGESPEALTDDLPLMDSHVLDSLGTLRLVDFLERQFGVSLRATELIPENLGSVAAIVRFVERKRDGR